MGAPGCPCGAEAPYEACCGPRHDGSRPAPTAEALMRSRYCAFARGLGGYLVATHAAPTDDAAGLERFARSVTWLGLAVERVEVSTPSEEDFVTFTARYLEGGDEVALHERSRFVRREGRWLYVDGEPTATRRRVPRNEPCPCGSGRKFKQCHA